MQFQVFTVSATCISDTKNAEITIFGYTTRINKKFALVKDVFRRLPMIEIKNILDQIKGFFMLYRLRATATL